jgi:hypothetical protein
VYTTKKPNKKQIVETGAENENHIVVLQGLNEGESILMNEPHSSKESTYMGLEIYKSILAQKNTLLKDSIDKN